MCMPTSTTYRCPACGSSVVRDLWTQTVATSDGEPEERTGEGFYCENMACIHNTSPISEEDFPIHP